MTLSKCQASDARQVMQVMPAIMPSVMLLGAFQFRHLQINTLGIALLDTLYERYSEIQSLKHSDKHT